MTGKSNKQILNIYIRRNLQIIKNSQTKCVKNKWFRSSLVFDTISLRQISPFTQSLWCFETNGHLPPKIKWSTVQKRSTQGYTLWTTQCLFLSLWHNMNAHWESFLKSGFLWMRDYENLYITEQTLCFNDNYYA